MSAADAEVEVTARRIVSDVLARGDAAVLEHTAQLDGWVPDGPGVLEVTVDEREDAWLRIPAEVRQALEVAAARIRAYHERQRPASWEGELVEGDGVRVGWQVNPMRRAGVYVPGGTAAYPSSVLMNVIPAKVAGVGEVVAVSPATGGVMSDVVLAAAQVAQVDRLFRVGGAQAVASLAFGTETIPRCDCLVGPGNAWVAAAKRLVAGRIAVDMEAGPSEVLVIADQGADPEHVAADLIAQAEHDPRAIVGLIAVEAPALIAAVEGALDRRLAALPRGDIATAALGAGGFVVEVSDRVSAAVLANEFAPEHLELLVEAPRDLLRLIRTAGAAFLGHHSPEALGDYLAGPNHVLPTAGTARFSSPLGVWHFVRRTSVVEASPEGLARLSGSIMALAEAEGLRGHADAVAVRGG